MPPQMTPAQARVVDPILSNHSRGYRAANRIGHLLFPEVQIPLRGARVLMFGKESFRLYNARRAPGANTKRVQYGYATDSVTLAQDRLEAVTPWELQEEAQAGPGIDLTRGSVEMVLDAMTLGLEYEQAQLATNPANYDANHKLVLAGADKWSDETSDPREDILNGKEAVRKTTGLRPNTLALSSDAFTALQVHPKIEEKFKYTSADSITTDMLARYFQVPRVVIGEASYVDEGAEDFKDIWSNVAILAYVPPEGDNYRTPSFGYTYKMPGMPMVEKGYEDRNANSWINPVQYERRPYLVGATAGFLFQTPV
jgi:hypothetical protein